jgi:glycosyltransferase EpsD
LKILFVANIHKHIKAFHIPYINYLKDCGFEVHVAANDGQTIIEEADQQINLPITRNPFSLKNIKAILLLKKTIQKEDYSLIHCHTAMGSVVARLAAKQMRKKGKLKIIYTAHGFHFFKNSPWIYWFLYYPIEKYLSKFTDAIILINDEDYRLVYERKFQMTKAYKINGVGINPNKFNQISILDKDLLRKKNGYDSEIFLIIYVAEFIDRKNHKFILEAIPLLKEKTQNFKFIFAGRGQLQEHVKDYANKLGIDKYVDFLGFRSDIGELITMSDIGVSVSKQEGLPMNIAEEMYAGKPVVATKIRGHVDLIDDGHNGFLFPSQNQQEFIEKIFYFISHPNRINEFSMAAKQKSYRFQLDNCLEQMKQIYHEHLKY